jgi:hypothetical protein
MSAPVVSRLWVAAAVHALGNELVGMRGEASAQVQSRLRVAAVAAEDLMNVVAGPRGRARSAAVAALVERFGDHAFDIDYMGATFIEEAVASALIEVGVDHDEAGRVADRCRAAVLEAAAALETLTPLIEA